MNTGDWINAARNLAEVAAIVIGGGWGYYKFVRGRTFHRRADLDLKASLVPDDNPTAVRVRVTMTSSGAASIPLRVAVVRIAAFRSGDLNEKGRANWRAVASSGVLADHEWVESQEAISDEVLVPLPLSTKPVETTVALRVTCLVIAKPKKRKTGTGWTRNVVVPVKLPIAVPIETGEEQHVPDQRREYQREVDEKEAKEVEREEEKQRDISEDEAKKVEHESQDE